jgi:hypothetical protein
MILKASDKKDPENLQELEAVGVPGVEHHAHQSSSCDHTHAVDLIAGSDSYSVLVKAYMVQAQVMC